MPKAIVVPNPRPSTWAQVLLAASIAFALLTIALLTSTL